MDVLHNLFTTYIHKLFAHNFVKITENISKELFRNIYYFWRYFIKIVNTPYLIKY